MALFKKFAFITVMIFGVYGCSSDDDTDNDDEVIVVTAQTLVDVAASNPDFSTLVDLLQATGLDAVLADTDTRFTVFAPTNAAFDALGQDTLNALAGDPETLSNILLYHVLTTPVNSAGAIQAAGTTVETANGDSVAITLGGTGVGVRVNTANITAVNIAADNGIIHVLDSVLLPPVSEDLTGNTIPTIAISKGTFETLITALQATGLDAVLANPDATFTVFAPTDDAFAALGTDTINALLGDTETLTEILLQHVISDLAVDSVTAMSLAGTSVTTASGNDIAIDIVDGNLTVGGAVVTGTNINGSNGVIHVIDAVIVGDVEVPEPGTGGGTGGSFDGGLATNGDFEDGLNGWNVSASVSIGTENGNSYASAEVTTAGNPYDVNLSQVLNIDAGAEYTLSFRARSTQARSILAGIGQNEAPWYADVQSVALTTDWQDFSLTVSAIDTTSSEEFGGANSRIIFDVGAEIGDVHIDEVNLTLNSGGGGNEEGFGDEQATNAGFDDGLTGWISTESVSVATEGSNSYARAEVTSAGDAFSVNLSQVVSIDPGAQYLLTFSARSTVTRSISAGIGLNEAPWSADVEPVSLTTDWGDFSLTLEAFADGNGQAFGGDNSRIIFDMGAEVGEVHIDNVSLRKIIGEGGEIVSTPDLTGYTLSWSDEFNGTDLNQEDWNIQLGDGTEFGIPGWGNQELQIYTGDQENLSIAQDSGESVLQITALEDGNGGYTSARINTYNKESFRYGKLVARVKLPETQGLWPAFWTLGDNINQINWPGVGEIDVFETRGDQIDKSTHTIHYVNANQQYVFNNGEYTNSENYSAGYNEFMIDWQPGSITWYVNGNLAYQLPIGDGMKEFNRPMHLLLNVAVGGNYPGDPDGTSVFPQSMYVDWVRYYEQDGFVADPPPALDPGEETVGGTPAGDGDPAVAIQTGFSEFGSNIVFNRFGAGGEPDWFSDSDAVDGDSSIRFEYPGGAFGGAWMVTESPRDLTAYANADLIFAIKKPASVADLEVKMESNGGADAGSMFLVNYTSTDLGNGWEEYRIPLADYVADGLDLSGVHIPFALWNPVDAQGAFPQVNILFDAIRIE